MSDDPGPAEDEDEDDYDPAIDSAAPHAKTLRAFLEGLAILGPHMDEGLETVGFCGGEHDIVWFAVDRDRVQERSEEGLALRRLGFHYSGDYDTWAWFT